MECLGRKTRTLTFLDLAVIGTGNAGGIGIFVLLGDLTKNIAGPATLISIAVSAVAALLAGFCCAEFGTRFVRADTAYVYSYVCHAESVAFVFGWALILQYAAGGASVAKGIMTYIDALSELKISNFLETILVIDKSYEVPYLDLFSPIIIIILTVSLICGLKDSLVIKYVFSFCNVALVLSLIAVGSLTADEKNWFPPGDSGQVTTNQSFTPHGCLGVLKGAALAFYAFVGFDALALTGRETRNGKRYLPLAGAVATFLAFAFFGGAEVVLTLTESYVDNVEGAALPIAFGRCKWFTLKWFLSIGAFFGFYTSLVGVAFPLPKTMMAMANDGLLFRFFAREYYNHQVPLWSVLFGGLLMCVSSGLFTFKLLVSLTVFTTLFVSTILAIDLILLRYTSIGSAMEDPSDEIEDVSQPKTVLSVKVMLKLLFKAGSNPRTKSTNKVVIANLVVFCIASTGLAVVLTTFNNYLMKGAIEAVIPSLICLAIMLLTATSMACQPQFRSSSPFKVPLASFLLCLSIFLNILLMTLLESLAKIYFLIWMSAGILPHFGRCSYGFWRGDVKSNSVFEINKLNALKLNESILKINSDKKAFYEGAVNPVFEGDEQKDAVAVEGEKEEFKIGVENGVELKNPTAIPPEQEKPEEELESEPRTTMQFLQDSSASGKRTDEVPDTRTGDESLRWECVAEIHTEDEFPEECYELQVVDNTYNFLSDMAEESPRDAEVSDDGISPTPETPGEQVQILPNAETNGDTGKSRSKSGNKLQTEKNSPKEKKNKSPEGENDFDVEIDYQHDKDFKEKLNILLKKQINMNDTLKEALSRYRINLDEADQEGKEEKANEKTEGVQINIKTLNKSQMKDKLELLLAKGPSKRCSLKNSFNINIKDIEVESGPKTC